MKYIPISFMLILCLLFSQSMMKGQDLPTPFTIKTENEYKNLEQVLSRYIQWQSISGEEKEAGKWLKSLCEDNGLYITQMGKENGNFNFAASLLPLDLNLPNVIFLNHIDVVPVRNHREWTHAPFSGQITEEAIWGRGAFDNKGPAIMQLFALLKYKMDHMELDSNYNVTFLAVSCEEIMCDGGISYVIENYLDKLNPSVVIGEGPPELSEILDYKGKENLFGISVAHKRPLWLELKLSMEGIGHGSINPSAYAIKEMTIALERLFKHKPEAKLNDLNVQLIHSISETKKGCTKFMLQHPRLFWPLLKKHFCREPEMCAMFTNTLTVTGLDAESDAVNAIPKNITATLDCRLQANQNTQSYLADLGKILKNDNIKISVIKTLAQSPASDTSSIFYAYLRKAIHQNYKDSKVISLFLPTYNDTGHFRLKGIPAFSVIPVIIDSDLLKCVHSNNERIPRSILNKGSATYYSFIDNCIKGRMEKINNSLEYAKIRN